MLNHAAAGLALLRDALLPPHCLACGTALTREAAIAGLLCAPCLDQAGLIRPPVCERCGLPLAEPAPLCTGCDWDPPAFRAARAALRYGGVAKQLILPFKYADRPEAAAGLASLMLKPGAALLGRADLLVPVPLHRRRLAKRGYNQAALLARALGRESGVPILADALARTRATPPLEGLDQEARGEALAGAIAIRQPRCAAIAGRGVLLIDDVLTTCATASACAQALLGAGAASVDVLTLARVADEHEV